MNRTFTYHSLVYGDIHVITYESLSKILKAYVRSKKLTKMIMLDERGDETTKLSEVLKKAEFWGFRDNENTIHIWYNNTCDQQCVTELITAQPVELRATA